MTIEIEGNCVTVSLDEYERSDYGTGEVFAEFTIDHDSDQIALTTTSGNSAHTTISLKGFLNAILSSIPEIQDSISKETPVKVSQEVYQKTVDDYDLEVDNLKADKKRCQSLAGKLALDARIKVVIGQCAKFRRDNF